MTTVSIVGHGNMGTAIADIVTTGGNTVEFIGHDPATPVNGEIVVLAVPYSSVADVLATHGSKFAQKVVVDITNPLDYQTFDSLVVAADSSAASEIPVALPESRVLKAFNTTFAGTLASRTVGGLPTTVLIAGDDDEAKALLSEVITAGGASAIDTGSLKRARELEALGFLQIGLAVGGKVAWTGGFAIAP